MRWCDFSDTYYILKQWPIFNDMNQCSKKLFKLWPHFVDTRILRAFLISTARRSDFRRLPSRQDTPVEPSPFRFRLIFPYLDRYRHADVIAVILFPRSSVSLGTSQWMKNVQQGFPRWMEFIQRKEFYRFVLWCTLLQSMYSGQASLYVFI